MAQVSNFWKTGVGAGDSPTNWTETDFARRNRAELTDPTLQGVYKGKLNSLAVSGTLVNNVTVATGAANVNGYYYENDTALTITAFAAPAAQIRYDRVVLRANMTSSAHADGQPAKSVRAVRIAGTEGAGTPPALTQSSGTYWEIPLAVLAVTTGGVVTVTDGRNYVPLSGTNEPAALNTATIVSIPYVTKRQGGDTVSWGTAGATNYNVTGQVKMQVGASVPTGGPTQDGAASGYQYSGSVTFPEAFSAVPLVMAQLIDIVSETRYGKFDAATFIQNGSGPTNSGFGYTIYFPPNAFYGVTQPAPSQLRVNWVAIGAA